MTIFTRDAVSEALHKAVEAKGGDYVYPGASMGACTYSDRQSDHLAPSCIVGHVVAELDPELFANWAEYEREESNSFSIYEGAVSTEEYDYEEIMNEDGFYVSGGDARKVRKSIGIDDPAVLSALKEAQRIQDAGGTWGEAQREFDQILGNA